MGDTKVRRRHSALAAAVATVAMAVGLTALPAEAAPPVADVDYVAVGDSYTAGTGASTFIPDFPCDQSPGGYVDLVNNADPVSLADNVACHGAQLTIRAEGVVPSVSDQIATLSDEKNLSKDTELVSLTAGANDIGVNNALAACVGQDTSGCPTAVLAAQAKLPVVASDLVHTLSAIHRAAPRARIVVLGYPMLFDPNAAPDSESAADQTLVNQGTVALNYTLAASVATANALYRTNAQYVDVTARFAGHAVNNFGSSWICLEVFAPCFNSVPNDPRNFHPNPLGHAAYAEALLGAVKLRQLARP